MADRLNAELLLAGYARGIFPMAESREDDTLYWFDPKWRGIIPLDGLHVSRSLRKVISRAAYDVRVNSNFRATVEGCAARKETWINGALFTLYDELHDAGYAHSLEIWEKDQLVGGIFGITLGGAFFGESMFSRVPNASKLALVYTVDRLNQCGFRLFDTQYLTPHLASMGGVEVSRADYRARLSYALQVQGDFNAAPTPSPQEVLQRITQTS